MCSWWEWKNESLWLPIIIMYVSTSILCNDMVEVIICNKVKIGMHESSESKTFAYELPTQ